MNKITATILILYLGVCAMAKNIDAKTLNATCQGWYPGDFKSLKIMIDDFLSKTELDTEKKPAALIVPHAGLAYSGQSAAYGYKKLISKEISNIFILGPAHRFQTDKLIVPESDFFQTPLGKTRIDKSITKDLIDTGLFEPNDSAFYKENSIELQVPFLQIVSPNAAVIPVAVGQLDSNGIKKAAEILKKYMTEESVFIISCDFTHYGYRFGYTPFSDNIKENIKKLDYGALEEIKKINPKGFLSYIERTQATICGYIPVAILLNMLPEDAKAEILNYTTSGDMTGDFANSVSYASVAFYKKSAPKDTGPENSLTKLEKESLLKLSRVALENYIKHKKIITAQDTSIKLTETLKQNRGAFVTLHKEGRLRGCIGEIFPTKPLYKVIIEKTIDSAVNDFRFSQVIEQELVDINIEISALTVPQKVNSYKDIVIGQDGILMKKGHRAAVFLPQVAPEQGWDLETTLMHLSQKAGLEPYAYREGAEFEVFQAEVFSEE
ncbi:MAG: AmmeMemoRadiSam system protein B [Candidatus Omnitrophica bacterium]|nr:AmmeMemoRadiSam system protein B [Candidatus Omnitrophota bacterium]